MAPRSVQAPDVPEVGIALVSIAPDTLTSPPECLASPAAVVATWAHPVGARSALQALCVVLHIFLVAALPSSGRTCSSIGWTRGGHSSTRSPRNALSLALLQIWVVDKLVSKHTQPLKPGDWAYGCAVGLHRVGLAHPKDGEKHPPVPAPGKHRLLKAVGAKAVSVEQVNAIEVAPVSVMHARLPHPIPGGPECATHPLGPVPLHLIGKGGHTTRAYQKEGDLVHESTCKEPGLSHLQLYLCLHELCGEALPFYRIHQVSFGKATMASLDGQYAVQA